MPPSSRSLRALLFGSVALLALTADAAAQRPASSPATVTAAGTPAAGAPAGEKTPLLLDADELTQDEALGIVTARGRVELIKQPNVLTADVVSWNRNTGIVTASGHVRITQPTGEVFFGDYAELTDDIAEGFVENVRALMADNSRMAGRHAERIAGNKTKIDRGVYSPCDLCADDPSRPPVWRIRARTATHDQVEQRVSYRDATLDLFGVPILYTPYLSHPDPSVKRKSGFLNPQMGFKSQLGFVARTFYYWDIAQDLDATFEAGEFSDQGPLLGAQLRKRFEHGFVRFAGSITRSSISSENGTAIVRSDDKGWRGHLFGEGRFDIDENWRAGFDLARSLDDVYVRRYGYSSLDVLRNRAFAEGFFGRSYVNASAYAFQDLRPSVTERQPFALPYVVYSGLGEPGALFGGRWSIDASMLSLTRTEGQDERRASTALGWQRRLVSNSGLVTTVDANIRTDLYWVNDRRILDPREDSNNGWVGRVIPQVQSVTSYPLSRPTDWGQVTLEPQVGLTLAPKTGNNKRIPNEDSRDVELDISNLFAASRFPGVDRVEDGGRLTYGVKTGLYTLGHGYGSVFLGQSYRFTGNTLFPDGSGLERKQSDYVGQIQISPGQWVDIDYRFRYAKKNFKSNLHEVNFSLGPPELFVTGTYLFAAKLPNDLASTDRNEITAGIYGTISRFWSANATATYRAAPDRQFVRYSTSITYRDECFNFSLDTARDLTSRVGGFSGTSVFFRIGFKNLGQFASPRFTE